eukprot:COSAG02_NODE_5557_length_4231_cov_1.573572_6_plen_43_part_01
MKSGVLLRYYGTKPLVVQRNRRFSEQLGEDAMELRAVKDAPNR